MKSINNKINNNDISDFINDLQDIENKLNKDTENLNSIIDYLNKNKEIPNSEFKAIIQNIKIDADRIDKTINNYNRNILPLVKEFIISSKNITKLS